MRRAALGRSSVAVTELGFGTAPIGNLYRPTDDETAHRAVDSAWQLGVRYFDTAPHYGLGLAERRLGAALRGRRRADYVVSTKVGRLLVPNPAPTGCDLAAGGFAVPDELTRRRDYSRDGVRRGLDASLERLGIDSVDVVYVHDPEQHMDQAIREAVPALVELREEGVVGAIGVGMNFVDPLLRFVTETDIDAVMLAGRWTLADRSGAGLVAACAERDVSVVAAAPFNSGLLALASPDAESRFDYGKAPADVLAFARRLADACASLDVTLPTAALRFPLRDPAVRAVVVGLRTEDEVRDSIAAATTPLPSALWDAIDALDPERPDLLRGGLLPGNDAATQSTKNRESQ